MEKLYQRKDIVRMMYESGYKQIEIAEKIGITRQRVHQIIRGYRNTGRGRERESLYRVKKICEACFKREGEHLHHKDGDNKNEAKNNLIFLCLDCHKEAHRKLRTKNCIQCKKEFTGIKRNICNNCYIKTKRKRKIKKQDSCKDCKKMGKITAKERCYNCYKRFRYKTSEKVRNYVKTYNKKHYIKKERKPKKILPTDSLFCYKCKLIKLKDKFHKDKGNPTGYRNQCKTCVLSYVKLKYLEKH